MLSLLPQATILKCGTVGPSLAPSGAQLNPEKPGQASPGCGSFSQGQGAGECFLPGSLLGSGCLQSVGATRQVLSCSFGMFVPGLNSWG